MNNWTHEDTEHHLVHFLCEDESYIGECYFNELPSHGMMGWLKENIGYAGRYICKVYDLMNGKVVREVGVTLP